MKLDFGSGYGACSGWATLDFGANCTYNDISEIPDKSITKIRFRNVLHHIEHVESLFKALKAKFRKNVKIIIIECRKEFFDNNVFLDVLWYRGIVQNPNMYIAREYRDFGKILQQMGFCVFQRMVENEKETIILKRGNIMENIKNQLEQAGFDFAVAIATQAEIEAGAACGQLAIINEDK
jgi:hypothetical protein